MPECVPCMKFSNKIASLCPLMEFVMANFCRRREKRMNPNMGPFLALDMHELGECVCVAQPFSTVTITQRWFCCMCVRHFLALINKLGFPTEKLSMEGIATAARWMGRAATTADAQSFRVCEV